MSKILIDRKIPPVRKATASTSNLMVSEMFSNTLQGEGIYIGHPATFLRLTGCHINCGFCDSTLIWRVGQSFTVGEILDKLEDSGTVDRFRKGEHLVITGGSPLLQEQKLCTLLESFTLRFGFTPFIQVENECTIDPTPEFIEYVSCWNNSPKLLNSGVERHKRYKPRVLRKMGWLDNSWFKFVIQDSSCWKEIEDFFLAPKLISREQIILMPKGYNQEELEVSRLVVAELAIEKCVKFSDRLQITLYDTKISV